MQELVSSETLNNEEEIIIFEENLKGPKGDKGDKGDDGYTPKKGVDYFTENDKQELIEAVTEDASSEFVQIVNSKTTEFNNNATSKTESFNSNSTNKLNEYNENHTAKLNAYNENSAEKLAEFNENAAEKLEEYDEHIEDLDNIVSKNTVNGESISIDDALKYKIFDCKIDGNAKQTTTTGKNLLSKKLNEYSKTTDYITVDEASDNLLKLSVSSESTAYENVQILSITVESGKTYTLSAKIDGNTNSSIRVAKANSGSSADNLGSAKNEQPLTFTCDGTYSHVGLFFYVSEGVKPTSNMAATFSNVQLEEGSVATDYEPYTGGEASPNPDYPQEISIVSDEVKIVQTGKNLIAKQGLSTPLNENDYYDSRTSFLTPGNNGWGHLECNNSSGSSSKYINIFVKKKNIYVKENLKYTLLIELKNVSNLSYLTVNQVVNDDLFQESRGINNGELVSDGIYKFYVTTKEELSNDMVLRIFTSVKSENVISFDMRLMILEGDWTDKEVEYEQYKSNEHTIDLQGNELVKLYDKAQDVIEIDKNGNVSLQKNTRHLSLAIADMNNSTNYPGWKNIEQLQNDYPNINGNLSTVASFKNNITSNIKAFGINTLQNGGLLFIVKSIIDLTQEEWLAQYPELILELYYSLKNTETFNLGTIQNFKTYEGVNHFFLETNLATDFEIKYAQDLQKVISKQQAEIDELKTLLSSTATSAMLLDNYANDLMEEV